jgi:hypothetical protein
MALVDLAAARPDIDARNLFIRRRLRRRRADLLDRDARPPLPRPHSIEPVVDWQSWLLTADIGPSIGMVWMGRETPWQAPEKYRARSPLTYAHLAPRRPCLMCGEADARTRPTEAMEMSRCLRLRPASRQAAPLPATSRSSSMMRPSLFAAGVGDDRLVRERRVR